MGASPLHSPRYRRFCRLLRQWRADANLTQHQLAERVGRPSSWVHKTEVGERRMDPIELVEWTRATGVGPVKAMRGIQDLH